MFIVRLLVLLAACMLCVVHAEVTCPKTLRTHWYAVAFSESSNDIVVHARMQDAGHQWHIKGNIGSLSRDDIDYIQNIAKRELYSAQYQWQEEVNGRLVCHYQTERQHELFARIEEGNE